MRPVDSDRRPTPLYDLFVSFMMASNKNYGKMQNLSVGRGTDLLSLFL